MYPQKGSKPISSLCDAWNWCIKTDTIFEFGVGDEVLVKNYNKALRHKKHGKHLPVVYEIIEVNGNKYKLDDDKWVERCDLVKYKNYD